MNEFIINWLPAIVEVTTVVGAFFGCISATKKTFSNSSDELSKVRKEVSENVQRGKDTLEEAKLINGNTKVLLAQVKDEREEVKATLEEMKKTREELIAIRNEIRAVKIQNTRDLRRGR